MGMIGKALFVSTVVAAIALGVSRREELVPLRLPVATTAAIPPRPTVDKSPVMQEGREKLIQKLIASGVFMKTGVPGTLPRVWVDHGFYTLTFDQKQQFVGVVYAYYYDGSRKDDLLMVYDGYTNKSVGSFTERGLSLR